MIHLMKITAQFKQGLSAILAWLAAQLKSNWAYTFEREQWWTDGQALCRIILPILAEYSLMAIWQRIGQKRGINSLTILNVLHLKK